MGLEPFTLLGGPWVVISRVISPLIWLITTVALLITPLITTHEPSSISSLRGIDGADCSLEADARGLASDGSLIGEFWGLGLGI